jgi:hypothetical protein
MRRTTFSKSSCSAPGEHVLDRRDERRVADDAQLAVDGLTELFESSHAVLRVHLGDVGLEALHLLTRPRRSEPFEDRSDVEARVPDVDGAHHGEARRSLRGTHAP